MTCLDRRGRLCTERILGCSIVAALMGGAISTPMLHLFGINRHYDRADRWKLRLAQILLVSDREAAGALGLLNKIDRRNLNEANRRKWDELVRAAKSARGPTS
jgi:hypothetical protein